MNHDSSLHALHAFLEKNKLPCSDDILQKFNEFYDLIEAFRYQSNLIGPLTKEQIYESLFCDSLTIGALFSDAGLSFPGMCVDVGSGAGFPGIPLAIVTSQQENPPHFTLVEPRAKRVQFLQSAVAHLGFSHVRVEKGRVERLVRMKRTFGLAMAKAFKPPVEWLKTASLLVDIGGYVAILYTSKFSQELQFCIDASACWQQVVTIDDVSVLGLQTNGPTRCATLVKLTIKA